MRIAFLTNNFNTKPVIDYLSRIGENIKVYDDHELIKKPVDCIISYNYRRILPKATLDLAHAVNLHISYLPWGRGAHPIPWGVLNNERLGVSIHWMVEKVDAGDIIAQRLIQYNDDDDMATLYDAAQQEIVRLFIETWPELREKIGDSHKAKELGSLNMPKGWKTTVKELREANQ